MTPRLTWGLLALVMTTTAGAQERPAAAVSGRWSFDLPVLPIRAVGAAISALMRAG